MAEEKDNQRRPIIDRKTGLSISVVIIIVGMTVAFTDIKTQFNGHVESPFLHENIVEKLEKEYVSQTEYSSMKEDVTEIKADVKEIRKILTE